MSCSIVIPTKDRPAGLLSAARSALEALPAGGEVIVVDDGSRVPAVEVLSAMRRADLRIITNPGPHGPSGARNFGVSQASQPVIFFLDDDDALMPAYCRTILDLLRTLPANTACGFSSAMVKVPGQPDTFQGKRIPSGILSPDTPLDERLTGLGTGFWIKRELYLAVGGLDPELRVNEDTEFSLRLSQRGVLPYYHSEPGVVISNDQVRSPGDQPSVTRAADAAYRYRSFEYILRKHRAFLADHAAFRRKLLTRVIKYRSRARETGNWQSLCRAVSPGIEGLVFRTLGWAWLHFSIAIRKLRN